MHTGCDTGLWVVSIRSSWSAHILNLTKELAFCEWYYGSILNYKLHCTRLHCITNVFNGTVLMEYISVCSHFQTKQSTSVNWAISWEAPKGSSIFEESHNKAIESLKELHEFPLNLKQSTASWLPTETFQATSEVDRRGREGGTISSSLNSSTQL